MNLKFRAWDKTTNQMRGCYGFNELEREVYVCSVADDEFNGQLRTVHAIRRSFDEAVVMQSTGLKDKNGVEIFERDIVHLTSDEGIDYNALIVFKDGGFCAIDGAESNYGFRRYDLSRFDLYLDVIGNVHENIELLEAAE